MRFSKSNIQTLRDAPSNARTQGFAWLVRANYLTRDNEVTSLGQGVISRLQKQLEEGQKPEEFFQHLNIPIIKTEHNEIYFAISTGKVKILQCSSCKYAARQDLARFKKEIPHKEEQLQLEKVYTPDCYTIEALADFLQIPAKKTAKAILLKRKSDNKFVFVVVRGDMQLSEAKLIRQIGEIRTATYEEISEVGASAGFASPIGLKNVLIVADDLIPQSPNLVAGANEEEHHLLNVNYGRDYNAEIIADIVEAKAGDACPNCDGHLELFKADLLTGEEGGKFVLHAIETLQALAEIHHDENGLKFPAGAAPYDIYLIVIPSKKMDTLAVADNLFEKLQDTGFSTLYDDRDVRVGIKFNDADLIGMPIRITVGERGLQTNSIELKLRNSQEKELIELGQIAQYLLENH